MGDGWWARAGVRGGPGGRLEVAAGQRVREQAQREYRNFGTGYQPHKIDAFGVCGCMLGKLPQHL